MSAWIAPFEIAAVLLAVAGILKTLHPSDTARALEGFGVRIPESVVRGGGAVEAAVACVAFLVGHPVAVAIVAASYGAFALFVFLAQRRRLPISSCGCFGRVDTPPSSIHLAVTVAAALVTAATLVQGPAGFSEVLAQQPVAGVPYVFLLALGTWLAFLAMTSLPRLLSLQHGDAE